MKIGHLCLYVHFIAAVVLRSTHTVTMAGIWPRRSSDLRWPGAPVGQQ
jgi:hypothetical protein